jgi:hypothetical protein
MAARLDNAWGVVATFLWLPADPIVDLERRREPLARSEHSPVAS